MKKMIISNLILVSILFFSLPTFAQGKKDKDKTVKLKIEKMVDGKKVVTDTTFILKKGEDLNKVLEKYGVNGTNLSGNKGKFNIKIESDDSIKNSNKQMVWVNVDNDGGEEHIQITQDGKKKKMIITDDADVQVMDDGNVFIVHENSGDTTKKVKRIVEEKGTLKNTKNEKIKKIYRFNGDSLNGPGHAMFFDDADNNFNKVIIKDLGNDSIEVFISKIIDKEMGNHFNFSTNEDFDWNNNNNMVFHSGKFKHSSAKVKLEPAGDSELNLLKLDKNYKKLDLNEFMVVFNGQEMNLSFTSAEKGDLTLNIIDDKGNSTVVLELKGFNGKFEKEMELQKAR